MQIDAVPLKRSITLSMLTFYGLGTIVGGGIYALVGKISVEAGIYAPISMIVASVLALLSALSYAELSARFPSSAGTPHYVHEAFQKNWLSIAVGWLVIATGVVSAATLVNAFVGFFSDLIVFPRLPGITLTVIALGGIAVWGISESVAVAIAITVLEVGGLLFVLFAAGGVLLDAPQRILETIPPLALEPWLSIGFGTFLIFYAFIGFEDMVTLAEEVKSPRRNLPLGIMLAIGLTTVLYVSVSLVIVLALPQEVLIQSSTPLASLIQHRGETAVVSLTIISMFAGVNGALVQLIMAARILYGMARKELAPRWLSIVNPKTQTPINGTLLSSGICFVLAVGFPLITLAKLTSTIILLIFMLINISLVIIKHRHPPPNLEVPVYPIWVPCCGAISSGGFVVLRIIELAK